MDRYRWVGKIFREGRRIITQSFSPRGFSPESHATQTLKQLYYWSDVELTRARPQEIHAVYISSGPKLRSGSASASELHLPLDKLGQACVLTSLVSLQLQLN
jgi:hypothetical protein